METKAPTNKFSQVPSVVISENIAERTDFFFFVNEGKTKAQGTKRPRQISEAGHGAYSRHAKGVVISGRTG